MASAHGQYNVSLAVKTPTLTCACSVDIEKHGCETDAPRKIHAQKALVLLAADGRVGRVHLVVTETGQRLFAEELGSASGDLQHLVSRVLGRPSEKIEVLPNKDGCLDRLGQFQPRTIDDLVTQYVCRVLSQIGLPQEKMCRWTGTQQASRKAKA